MAIKTYTEDELRELYLAQIRTLIPTADTAPFSDFDLWARALAAASAGTQAHAASLARQRFPKDCDDSELPTQGAARGLYYLAPTKAHGQIAIYGNAGDVQPAGSTFTLADGRQYVSTADATIAAPTFATATIVEGSTRDRLLLTDTTGIDAGSILAIGSEVRIVRGVPAAGIVDLSVGLPFAPFLGLTVTGLTGAVVSVEALEAGATYNVQDRDVTVDSPAAAILGTGRLALVSGGAEAESAGELRQRIVDFDSARPAGTNVGAVQGLAKAYPDARIAEAFVYPNFGYPGALRVVAYGPSKAREISTGDTDALAAFLTAAIGSEVDLYVDPITYGTAADVDVTITPGTGYEPDWGTSTTNTATIGVGSTVSRVELTTSPVGVIPVGARVLVPVTIGSGYRTEQRQVSSVDASGIDLTSPLSGLPTSGGTVTSGSPNAAGILRALEDLFDVLGPGTYVTSASKDRLRWPNPASRFGAVVSSSLILSRLADVEGSISIDWTSGSFSTITPAALETVRLGVVTLRYVYP